MITRMLLDLGLSQHLKGWTFASTAITLILEDFTLLDGITKRLYPEVARIHGTTSGRVERGIRHAIEEAWKNGDPEAHYACFRNTLSAEKAKPTNSQFLARVAHAARAALEQ